MNKFGTLMTAIVTPFRDDLTIDFDMTARLTDHVLTSGSDTVIVASSTGEQSSLTEAEKSDLFRCVVEAAAGRGAVVAGTGTADLPETIRTTQAAEKAGIDGALVLSPYYARPPQSALVSYFEQVASATDMPVILYHIPQRTASWISPETAAELSAIPNIVGIKDASGDFDNMLRLLELAPEDFYVYGGDEPSMLAHLAMGATGIIGVASLLVGPEMRNIIDLALGGDFVGARAAHSRLLPLFRALYTTTNPILVREALAMRGLASGPSRPPLLPATESEIATLKPILELTGAL